MSDASLTEELKHYIVQMSHGSALVGVASVDRLVGAPQGHRPCNFVPDAHCVVVIGLPIVSGLMNWPEYMAESELIKEVDTYVDEEGVEQTWSPRTNIREHIVGRCCYEVLNDELQTLSMYGAILLEKAGYVSTYLPSTYGSTFSWPGNWDPKFPLPPGGLAPFSHRHAAVAAGLGQFGWSNLVLTPQYGPRQRFVSIITRAPLVADPLITEPLCQDCGLCVKGCPTNALGDPYELEVGGLKMTLAKFDTDACRGLYNADARSYCTRECMTACPVGNIESPSKDNER